MASSGVETGELKQRAPARGMPDDVPEQPGRVLVADDEHLVASGLATNLRDLGYEVMGPVADGDAAVELCRRDRPDLALLDIRMPGTDGLDAAAVIYGELQVPVIIFSAYSGQEEIDRSQDVGVFGYLLKPVTRDQLRVGIAAAWGRYREYIELDLESSRLRQRLDDRKYIEQAKWALVKRRQIDEPEAMRALQRHARNSRKPLVEVARSVLDNDAVLNDG